MPRRPGAKKLLEESKKHKATTPKKRLEQARTEPIELPQDELLNRLADRIRAVYFRNRDYASGKAHDDHTKPCVWDRKWHSCGTNVWRRIAETLVANGISDPERFIRAQFAYSDNPSGLLPTYLLGQSCLDNYRQYCAVADRQLRQLAASQIALFARLYAEKSKQFSDRADCCRMILMDSANGLTPLFRYLVASSDKLEDVCQFWQDAAETQYLLDPTGYDSVWSVLFDPWFAEFVRLLQTKEPQHESHA